MTRDTGRFWALTGPAFAGLFVAGVAAQGNGSASFPITTDPAATVTAYFTTATTTGLVAGLQMLSAFALAAFAVTAAARARAAGAPTAATAALAGGLSSALFQAFSAACVMTLANPDVAPDPPLAQALYQLAFWTGGPLDVAAFGVLLVATAVALRGTVLPAWAATTGVVIGAIACLAVASSLVWPLVVATPVGRFGGFAWVVLVAALLVARPRVAAAAR